MSLRGYVVVLSSAACAISFAQTIDPYYASNYSFVNLGSVAGVPTNYGGLTLKYDDPNTLLIGGAANGGSGAIYSIGVVRDGSGHITGFSGSASLFATAPNIDGGLAYGPGNVLFATGFPSNTLMQFKPGSSAPDRTDNLTALGISSSVGAVGFVPAGFNGAGRMKIASYSSGGFYNVNFAVDGSGTYNLSSATLEATPGGGPEGFAYVPLGSALFPNQSMLMSEYGTGAVSTFEIDAEGDPIVASRRLFMTGLSGAEGAFIDSVTGDFLFSTFGGSNRIVRVSGFNPVPEPASIVALTLGGLALLRRRQTRAK